MVNYLKKNNKELTTYGINNPTFKKCGVDNPIKKINKGENKMGNEEYKELNAGEVVKFDKEGDSIEGKYMGYQESATFKNSWALKIKTAEGLKVVFVSSIVTDLINSNNIQKEQQIKLQYLGKIKNKAGTFEYKDYKLFIK